MRILIFGGTTEGRVLAEELTGRGHQVTVSVATALGAEELSGIPCIVWQGRLDEQEMATRIRAFDLVVDATHPYAEVVSGYIRAACNETGVSLRRVLRAAAADASVPAEAFGATAARDTISCADDRVATHANMDPNAEAGNPCIRVDSCKTAAEYLRNRTGNVLVATGSKALRSGCCS